MINASAKDLTLTLLHADSEPEVIQVLKRAGYWDSSAAWRLYGDRDGNFATIGNQQSRPEAALVEKLINSVDARLLNECLLRGLDPTSDEAPQSMHAAIGHYFSGSQSGSQTSGLLKNWPQSRQLEQSQFITVAVTGPTARAGSPCVTIADQGEGQTPARLSETFLSIDRSNKLRIPFVQGKFNMGGTGALKFCGQHSLQLIISRRNPAIIQAQGEDDSTGDRWGATIVRRERPTSGSGHVRNSVFRYLAPVGAEASPEHGSVLSFSTLDLNVMPLRNQPYARPISYGSVVKLFEYDMKGFKSHALMKGGLLSRLEILLPEIGLPVRIHECRAYRGDEARSFANSLVGLLARLEENRADNIEDGYPDSVPFTVHGEHMIAQILAFKSGKAESYRTNEGIIFTINGQTHASLPKTFFSRDRVKMGRLASSLLVVVECSRLSVGAREDLFMNSRDRLSAGELRKSIEQELEELIGHHPGLKELRERRRSEEIAERLEDSGPLESVIESVLRSSPTLSRLFLLGQRLNRPHRADGNEDEEGGGRGTNGTGGPFVGKPHPSFFRFHKRPDGQTLIRQAQLGRRCRVRFDTDVENQYFSRDVNRGQFNVEIVSGALEGMQLDNSLTLYNGIANWSITLPEDAVSVGDEIVAQCSVGDDGIPEPFVNIAHLRVAPKTNGGGQGGKREGRTGGEQSAEGGSGDLGTGGKQPAAGPKQPAGIQLPRVIPVRRAEWSKFGFDERSASKIVDDGSADDNGSDEPRYTFYVNVDNVFLRNEMKDSRKDVQLMEAKFKYGNVLVGLALIHDHRERQTTTANGTEEETRTMVEDRVAATTVALAPFLIPMIDFLGALSTEDVTLGAQTGDEE